MKKLILTGILAVAITTFSFAQTAVTLKINHRLNTNEFAYNETGTNNLGQDFNADRLEYYLSQISIVHDGGTYTMMQDYAIIDAGLEAILELGEIDASTIEAISFYVGVGEDDNHSDPASWSAPHPLAPRFPAMHWGWAAGFRFLAIEGTDLGSNQEVQIHALGDGNYFETLIPIDEEVSGDAMVINIDANYEKIYNGIDISGGLIQHSESGVCITALENMRDLVFAATRGPLSIPENGVDFTLKTFPNPAIGGNVTVDFNTDATHVYDITIIDILGKTVVAKTNIGTNATIDLQLPTAGLYLVNVSQDGLTIHTEKIISQ